MIRLRWFVFGAILAAAIPVSAQLGIIPANVAGFYPSTGGAAGTVLAGGGVGSPATFTASPTGLTSLSAGTITATSLFQGNLQVGNVATTQIVNGAANLYVFQTSGGTGFGVNNATNGQMWVLTGAGDDTAIIKANRSVLTGKTTTYNNVVTSGHGVPAIYGYGGSDAVTNTGTASIAAYTVGAADGTFEVGCNILVTTSTNHTFSCDVVYTDTAGNARTMVLPVTVLAGTFATTGLITNITGVGPYTSPTMVIRADATTSITVRTSAGGTYTGVVYNPYAFIAQVG